MFYAHLIGIVEAERARLQAKLDAEDTRRKQDAKYDELLREHRRLGSIEGECVEIVRDDKLLTQQ